MTKTTTTSSNTREILWNDLHFHYNDADSVSHYIYFAFSISLFSVWSFYRLLEIFFFSINWNCVPIIIFQQHTHTVCLCVAAARTDIPSEKFSSLRFVFRFSRNENRHTQILPRSRIRKIVIVSFICFSSLLRFAWIAMDMNQMRSCYFGRCLPFVERCFVGIICFYLKNALSPFFLSFLITFIYIFIWKIRQFYTIQAWYSFVYISLFFLSIFPFFEFSLSSWFTYTLCALFFSLFRSFVN